MYSKITIVGSIAFDEIMDFPQEFVNYFHPEKLHQINVSFVVDTLEKQLGGTATNIAYNLSMVSDKIIVPIGAIGKDGKEFLSFFKKQKIETKGILIDKNIYTASGKVITDKKDNQIWGFYYGASRRGKDINMEKLMTDSLLILSATHKDTFLKAQRTAIKNKIDYMYDPGMVLTWIDSKDLEKGITNSKYLIGNDYEIARILQILNTDIITLSKKDIHIITTLGEQGVMYQYKNEIIETPAYKVHPVDPTGAGDAWRAGFMAGVVDGKEVRECLLLGNVMASFAVEKRGTVNHGPTKKKIMQRYQKLKNLVG